MEGFEEKKNISNLTEFVYQINGRSSDDLAKEFDFDEFEEEIIRRTFCPIITLYEIDVDSIIAKTIDFKEEFINYYKEFDIDIFKREHLGWFEYEIKKFLSVVKRGKFNVWDIKKGKYFYHLKLDSEIDTPNHQTLLITEKDEIQLEFYFKKIIAFIESFTENHTIFNPKNTTQKTKESIKSKRLIIDIQQENNTHFSELTLNNFMELTSDLDAIMNKDFNCQYHSLSEIEVDEYLERKSDNYSLDKLEKMLFDSDVFDNMVLKEETNSICTEEYINRELEIPTYKVETILGINDFYNYKEMRNKIMPFSSYLFHYFRSQMQKKINEIKLNNEKDTEPKVVGTDNQLKNLIAHKLIGNNKISSKSIEYHHIYEILNKYSISKIEARQILLDMQGSFSLSTNEIIVKPIILYLERSSLNLKKDTPLEESTEVNIFNRAMNLEIPRNHFKKLTTNNSKNGLPFLTEIQLENFIQRAFLGKNLPIQNFNQAPKGEKLLLQSVFYEFYELYCIQYFDSGQVQDKFIVILTNNFHGWNYEKLRGNFKPKTTKRLL